MESAGFMLLLTQDFLNQDSRIWDLECVATCSLTLKSSRLGSRKPTAAQTPKEGKNTHFSNAQ